MAQEKSVRRSETHNHSHDNLVASARKIEEDIENMNWKTIENVPKRDAKESVTCM
jgi:hypothetical protein